MKDITTLTVQVLAYLTALGGITAVLQKHLTASIKDLDYNNCKSYLTDFLADISSGLPKTEIQKQRACEIYERYRNLKGNSYIEKEWNRLMK